MGSVEPRDDAVADPELRLTLAAEQIEISRTQRITGSVRVAIRNESHVEPVSLELRHDEVDIERVPIGREVTSTPDVRQDGDVTIIPVVKEIVVIERRLILTEEIRVRRRTRIEHHTEQVTLRTQRADIRRTPATDDSAGVVPPITDGEQNGE